MGHGAMSYDWNRKKRERKSPSKKFFLSWKEGAAWKSCRKKKKEERNTGCDAKIGEE
jgi:hypothetical protein